MNYCFIGDSHVWVMRGVKNCTTHHLGAITAYNLASIHSTTSSKQKVLEILADLPKDNIVVMSAGEIDCRLHIYNQSVLQHRSINRVIDDVIIRYRDQIIEFKKKSGLGFMVLGIPAPGMNENPFGYNHFASMELRITIFSKFNKKLKAMCKDAKIPYINVYKETTDAIGKQKRKYKSDDGIHLNPIISKFIMKELESMK